MKGLSSNKYLKSSLLQNSAWGVFANLLQIALVFIFFAIIARRYNNSEFARFLIATTVYQLVAAFSSLGLGQWFIREYATVTDRLAFTGKFLKTQLGLGLVFYLVNIVLACVIYQDVQIRTLCLILGTNIIFDNAINAIKSLNIAEGLQRKTATILVIDGFLKLLAGCLLFIYPLSVVVLASLMILVRILTLSLFIRQGSSGSITLRLLWLAKISYADVKVLVIKNWQFIVIGSISLIYWKIGNIIISKFLTLTNVADYEIAFRFFSVLQILPVVASATIYPRFIKYFAEKDHAGIRKLYHAIFVVYTLFAVVSYVFIYTYADWLIPLAFGNGYPAAAACLQQMFLTFLILPTVLLQANLLVAVGLEKTDMWFNIISLVINVAGCLAGLYFFKQLAIVNYAVFFSFLVFHLLQDRTLVNKEFMKFKHCLLFYLVISLTVLSCRYFTIQVVNPTLFFAVFVIVSLGCCVMILVRRRKEFSL
jgi:O-antigen/teichoic acid export membrane protein